MAGIKISEVKLYRISVPLKQPFSTHLQIVTNRESILVEVIDSNGVVGLGECVAFSSPWYTEETVQTGWDALVKWLIPSVTNQVLEHPSEIESLLAHIKGNRMAKAALDQAIWDLYARHHDVPLWKLIGGDNDKIDAGIVLTGIIDESMVEAVQEASKAGYRRVKLKIDTNMNPGDLKRLISTFKQTLFFGDANGIFDKLGIEALRNFDDVGLTLIEQPFGEDNWDAHVKATKIMKTPIALDESIRSVRDVRQMVDMRAGSIIVLKPGRVGGLTESLKIVEIAKKNDLAIWIGGMIEFGVSKAHNLALASLTQFTLPGDFSASTHFWEDEPVKPEVVIRNGRIHLTDEAGIGVTIHRESLLTYTIDTYEKVDS